MNNEQLTMNNVVSDNICDLFKRKNRKVSIGIGLSGGVDSVVLADILIKLYHESEYVSEIVLIHFNHGLRGDDSDNDENFVKLFAEKYAKIDIVSMFIDVKKYSKVENRTIEEAARILRYEKFEEIKEKRNLDYICLAHHKDDLVETVLFNIFRGTGLAGLNSLKSKRDFYVRPLLEFTKDDILSYAEDNRLEFRQDKTNFENEFSRNKLRNIIIPSIEDNLNRKISNSISNLSKIAEETLDFIDDYFIANIVSNKKYIRIVDLKDHSIVYEKLEEQNFDKIIYINKINFEKEKDIIKKMILNYSFNKVLGDFNYNINYKDSTDILNSLRTNVNTEFKTVYKTLDLFVNEKYIIICKTGQNLKSDYQFNIISLNNSPVIYNYFNLSTILIGVVDNQFKDKKTVTEELRNNRLFFIDLSKVNSDDFVIKQLEHDIDFVPFGSKSNQQKKLSEILSNKKIEHFYRDKLFMICEQDQKKSPIFISKVGIDKRVSLNNLDSIFEKRKKEDKILYIKIMESI